MSAVTTAPLATLCSRYCFYQLISFFPFCQGGASHIDNSPKTIDLQHKILLDLLTFSFPRLDVNTQMNRQFEKSRQIKVVVAEA
jgi:hypothetical protein